MLFVSVLGLLVLYVSTRDGGLRNAGIMEVQEMGKVDFRLPSHLHFDCLFVVSAALMQRLPTRRLGAIWLHQPMPETDPLPAEYFAAVSPDLSRSFLPPF